MKDDKKSILKEALSDYNEIMEAADANAKKKLAEEFPEKFNNLIKEEINKNKKSVKESYKKMDDDDDEESENSDNNKQKKEPVMKNEEKETKKVVDEPAGEGKPFGEKAKKVAAVEEDVKITDTVKRNAGPFTDKAKVKQRGPIEEEREKDFVGDIEGKTPNIGKGEAQKGKAFTKKIKSGVKPISNLTEEFDITDLDMDSVGSALENADDDDQILTMEDIEREISGMEELGEELEGIESTSPSYMDKGNKGIAFDQLVSMRKQLDEMIKSMDNVDEMHQPGNETFGSQSQINRLHSDGPTDNLVDEMPVDEMHQGNFPLNKMHAGQYDSKLIDEEPITDKDVEDVLGAPMDEEEVPVEEAHGLAYSSRRQMAGRQLPGQDYLSQGEKDQSPEYVQEAEKKLNRLITENKSLTKKLNEVRKYKDTVGGLLENYKTALDKYRNQLKEMAIFNTNLAHVNNLLVNEELALTQNDKIKIINEFKKVDNIAESQKKYKSFLTEMKESRKTLTESIEEKVNVSIQPSSKQKLDEVTAYKDDAHISKMKKMIESIEKRDKKIIR